MLLWLYDIPTWLLFVIIVGGFSLLGVGGLLVGRTLISRTVGRAESYKGEAVGDFVAATSILFGLIAALLTVAVWQNYTDLDTRVSQEASSLGAMYRLALELPQPTRDELTGNIKKLTYDTMSIEWEEQRHGIKANRPDLLNAIRTTILQFKPTSSGESNLQSAVEAEFAKMYELRRHRRHDVDAGVPGALYAVVLIGGLATVALTWLLPVSRVRMHIVMNAIVSAMIGMIVFTIILVDHPFRGAISIGPEAFEDAFNFLMDGQYGPK